MPNHHLRIFRDATYPSNYLFSLTLFYFCYNFIDMQCPRCSYIRFKSAPKCVNCNFQFKSRKSAPSIIVEPENVFTIFAHAGQLASNADEAAMEAQSQPAQEMEDIISYDSPPPADYPENFTEHSGDFELDLSDADGFDAEDLVMDATLTEDLSNIADIAAQESDMNFNEIEVAGLGFHSDNESADVATELEDDSAAEPADEETALSTIESAKDKMGMGLQESETAPVEEDNVEPSVDLENPAGHALLEIDDNPEDSLLALDDDESEVNFDPDDKVALKTGLDRERDDAADEARQEGIYLNADDNAIELDPDLQLQDLDLDLDSEHSETLLTAEKELGEPELMLEDLDLEMESSEEEDPPKKQ